MKILSITLFFVLSIWSTYWASIYNFDDTNIQKTLEKINQSYNLNTDVHVLNSWDDCARRTDFSACIRKASDDWVDLIFIINNELRKMETSIRDTTLYVLPKSETLNFEQAAVQELQAWNISKAIQTYLASLTKYLSDECNQYNTNSCTITSLASAKKLFEEQQAEDRARKTVKYLWTALLLLVAVLVLLGLSRRWKLRKRNANNKNVLNQLLDHTSFLNLTIEHDTYLSKTDKKTLLKELWTFEQTLETLATSSAEYLHIKLSEGDYVSWLETLTHRYQKMLELIWNSEEIMEQVEKIRGINI